MIDQHLLAEYQLRELCPFRHLQYVRETRAPRNLRHILQQDSLGREFIVVAFTLRKPIGSEPHCLPHRIWYVRCDSIDGVAMHPEIDKTYHGRLIIPTSILVGTDTVPYDPGRIQRERSHLIERQARLSPAPAAPPPTAKRKWFGLRRAT